MSVESVYIGRNCENIETSANMKEITYVVLTVEDTVAFTAGTYTEDSAMLKIECPYATQLMANNILASLSGFKYQPLIVTGVALDPAFEIGDAMTAAGRYTGIYTQNVNFYGNVIISDVSAETDEEFEHEYTYKGDSRRYATYLSLKNGTAEVSGACISTGSICGSGSGASSAGSNLKSSQIVPKSIGRNDVDFGGTLDTVDTLNTTLSDLQTSVGDIARGIFNSGIYTTYIELNGKAVQTKYNSSVGGYVLYVNDLDGYA